MSFKAPGFSLIEVVVSGALVATTVGAVFAASSMAIRLSTQSQDRLIASQLAREGIEIVRSMRDANFIANPCLPNVACQRVWTDGILTSGESLPLPASVAKHASEVAPYRLETVSDNTATCTDFLIRKTDGDGTIVSGDVPKTGQQLFCRRILIEPTQSSPHSSIRVRSQVAWLGESKKRLRSLSEVKSSPGCSATKAISTEWCSEQVTILTDWRPL